MFAIGFIILLHLTWLRLEGYRIGNRPLLLFGVLLVLSGLQIFFTGFIADLFINKSNKNHTEAVLLKYSKD